MTTHTRSASRRPRNETDLDALTGEFLRVVQEMLQPEGVSVWLNPDRGTLVSSDAHRK